MTTTPSPTDTGSDLIALAERCEAATGPDIVLTQDIADYAESAGLISIAMLVPDYTASIDAALTLVPGPDWEWSLEWETGSDGQMFARCALGDPMRFCDCEAPTLALAICAAALRARAAQ